ncbi:MAG: T9SS type A sorting domain-containing protein [Bacteroidota bacterium]
MKLMILRYTIAAVIFLSIPIALFAQTATAPSGSGTSVDPYIITSLAELSWLAQSDTAWGRVFVQQTDINASATQYWDNTDDNTNGDLFDDPNDGTSAGNNDGFLPIGNSTVKFTGTYYGNGYAIDNLHISKSAIDNVALFGYTFGAVIDSLGVTNGVVAGRDNVGALIGYADGGTVVRWCHSSGSVSGATNTGGLVGACWGSTLSKSFSTVSVTGTDFDDGGFVGILGSSTAIACYSSGAVSGPNETGGFAGNSYSSTVQNCYATGNVSGGDIAGGFLGLSDGSPDISNCFSTGTVTGTSDVGGFVGAIFGSSTITNCFWDTQTSGLSSSAAGTGKTTTEMKDQSTFLNAGWDANIWYIGDGINNGYPYLYWQNESGSPLPISFVLFTTSVNGRNTELFWITATEVNNYGFEIERKQIPLVKEETSEVSEGFVKIGFVEGNGTTNAPKEYSFIDRIQKAGKYLYRLKQIDRDGKFSYSQEVEVTVGSVPQIFSLEQNYPNPFNPTTTIGFTLQVSDHTTLKIYDAVGREVAMLVNEPLEAGVYHQRTFDATKLSSGVYFARLQSGNKTQLKKMILMK